MKTLFLAEILVRKQYYMGDETESMVTRIVEAESEDEARDKIRKHYDDKTDEYSVYYSASVVNISETIT